MSGKIMFSVIFSRIAIPEESRKTLQTVIYIKIESTPPSRLL